MTPDERLTALAEQLTSGETPPPVTVRAFLGWFGAQRRGYYISKMIRRHLDVAGLSTEPDFEGAFIDAEIAFRLGESSDSTETAPSHGDGSGVLHTASELPESSTPLVFVGGGVPDPTHRIGKLAAANTAPVTVTPDTTLREAVTLMLMHNYSQLPVMQGERTVKGMITWESIGSRLALNCSGTLVRDYLIPAVELSADASLFSAISAIVEHQYVLIRGAELKITGIVTTSDLSIQFQQLAEPFLLLGEIENHIRRILDGRFTADELKTVLDPTDKGRDVQSVADLTFGEYVRLLENPARWQSLQLGFDRAAFTKQLDLVREIRNDVMHFDPDGVADGELIALRKFAGFLQTLQSMGAT